MRFTSLLDNMSFSDDNPNAEPLFVDELGRIIRFTLRPGQTIREHSAPHSPFYVVVLKGQGIFVSGDGQELTAGPNSLLLFEPNEIHSVRALEEDLVFVGFLHGAPAAKSDRTGGVLGRQ